MDSAVLFISPYVQDARSIALMLDDASFAVVHAINLKVATARFEARRFPVVLTEANLEDGNWLDVLDLTRPARAELIVTDAWADARFWAEAINRGAYDLLAQPFYRTEVRRVLTSASSRRIEAKSGAAA